MHMNMQNNSFTKSLREWRKLKKLSQLELALAADVSQRHVSWLETGRSQPSREMVIKLADAMEIPLRDRNKILNAAGFTDMYVERNLHEPIMEPVNQILHEMLNHHEPYPAFVLDRHWNIKMKNQAADLMFQIVGDPEQVWRDIGNSGEHNIALLTVHPNGLRKFISNWDQVGSNFIHRLKKEALDSGDPEIIQRYETLAEFAGDLPEDATHTDLLPILLVEINLGGPILKLCSVISTFGTAQDITANELRIEAFYPADEMTRKFFVE